AGSGGRGRSFVQPRPRIAQPLARVHGQRVEEGVQDGAGDEAEGEGNHGCSPRILFSLSFDAFKHALICNAYSTSAPFVHVAGMSTKHGRSRSVGSATYAGTLTVTVSVRTALGEHAHNGIRHAS